MLKGSIGVLLSLCLALPVQAAIFKWVDHGGTVHFADDFGKVPAAYRKSAQVVNGEEQSVEVTETTIEPGGKKPQLSVSPHDGGQTAGKSDKKKVYGGKDEEAWRKEFGRLKEELRATEEYLADTRKRKESTATLSRRDYLSLQQGEKDAVSRIESIKQKIQSLTESADKAGVPNELR